MQTGTGVGRGGTCRAASQRYHIDGVSVFAVFALAFGMHGFAEGAMQLRMGHGPAANVGHRQIDTQPVFAFGRGRGLDGPAVGPYRPTLAWRHAQRKLHPFGMRIVGDELDRHVQLVLVDGIGS